MSELLKLGVSVLGALMVIGGLFQGVIVITGGSIPFWASKRDFDMLKNRVDQSEIQERRQQCFEVQRRLRNAKARAASNPTNAVEAYIVEQTEREFFDLEC